MFNRHFYSGEGLQDDDRSGATVLVGHSYGGMAISEAAHAENVAALVYVSGFEPEKGERAENRCAWEYTPGKRA